jgi:hypothetical protein
MLDCPQLHLCTYIYLKTNTTTLWLREEVCTGCWWGSLRERDNWGDPDVDGTIILRGIFRK